MQKLIDCSLVQTYITNSARVVFLNQRPQSRLSKGLGNSCETCDRVLQEPYRYCSVRCKVDAVKNLSSVLQSCNSLQLREFLSPSSSPTSQSPKDEKLEMEGGEEMYPEESLSSTSSASDRDECWLSGSGTAAHAIFPLPKKLRSSNSNRCGGGMMVSCSPKSVIPPSISRRKGFPHRSPLYWQGIIQAWVLFCVMRWLWISVEFVNPRSIPPVLLSAFGSPLTLWLSVNPHNFVCIRFVVKLCWTVESITSLNELFWISPCSSTTF